MFTINLRYNSRVNKNTKIFLLFFSAAVFITILHFLYHPIRVLGMDTSIFYMDERITLAAFYTTVISFLIGFLSFTHLEKLTNKIDMLLTAVFGSFFLLLSADEYFEMHEYANTLIKMSLKNNSLGVFAETSWIFPLGIFIILILSMFVVTIIREKRNTIRIPLILGLVSYMTVLILELFGGQVFGKDVYVMFVGFEEGFEMIGGSFFLLSTLRRNRG